jgi:hypothetical protein
MTIFAINLTAPPSQLVMKSFTYSCINISNSFECFGDQIYLKIVPPFYLQMILREESKIFAQFGIAKYDKNEIMYIKYDMNKCDIISIISVQIVAKYSYKCIFSVCDRANSCFICNGTDITVTIIMSTPLQYYVMGTINNTSFITNTVQNSAAIYPDGIGAIYNEQQIVTYFIYDLNELHIITF